MTIVPSQRSRVGRACASHASAYRGSFQLRIELTFCENRLHDCERKVQFLEFSVLTCALQDGS